MTTLLMILIVVTTVVFALGFGCGWWVRNAKVKEWDVWADELVKTAKALHDEAARIAPDQVKPWSEYECRVISMVGRKSKRPRWPGTAALLGGGYQPDVEPVGEIVPPTAGTAVRTPREEE